MFTTKKIALVSVINDLVTDNRVNRACQALGESGYDVILVGRKLPGSLPLPQWTFRARRMKLLFKTGPAFYLFFNLRLFFFLLFKRADLLYANDLDTLLPNYLVARIKGIPIIYDSHELFCEVPELQHSTIKRSIWLALEGRMVPRLKHCITVNKSIATIFENKYKTRFAVVRNIPEPLAGFVPKSRKDLGVAEDRKMLLLQGAGINMDRGAEELVEAMRQVDGAVLYIVGGGDVWPILEKKLDDKELAGKVRLIGKLPKRELLNYTFNADLGFSIDKDTNLNYRLSLPNKLFDYIQAGVPIVASRLPEIERIITHYQVGGFISDHSPSTIAEAINRALQPDRQKQWRDNLKRAASELTWEIEKKKLMEIIEQAGFGAK